MEDYSVARRAGSADAERRDRCNYIATRVGSATGAFERRLGSQAVLTVQPQRVEWRVELTNSRTPCADVTVAAKGQGQFFV